MNAKSKCNNLLKQSKKNYIRDTSNKGAATSKILAKKEQQLASHSGIQSNPLLLITVFKQIKA